MVHPNFPSNEPEGGYENIPFSTRRCEVCDDDVDAPGFGRHVMTHEPEEIEAEWPGGIAGFYGSLQESIHQSFREAEGYPEVQARLTASLLMIESIRSQFGSSDN